VLFSKDTTVKTVMMLDQHSTAVQHWENKTMPVNRIFIIFYVIYKLKVCHCLYVFLFLLFWDLECVMECQGKAALLVSFACFCVFKDL
jgi:hypothetical protein